MRTFTIVLLAAGLFAISPVLHAQTPGTKGNGQVFYSETFGWENPDDTKGWTAAPGYFFLDPTNIGYNWVWWPGDKGFVSTLTQDPPLNSTTRANGCVALFLEEYNRGGELTTKVDNSICFPTIDCSSHSSVVVRYQTHFMVYSIVHMWLEVSVDNWHHSASYNVNFGCGHRDRPMDKPKGAPALLEMNISDVAAGMPEVRMRLHWVDTHLFYWAVDDFSLSEAWSNDIKLNYVQMDWDDSKEGSQMAWIASIPKSQLDGTGGFLNYRTKILNFGENDQEDVYLDVDITKNGISVFHKMSAPSDVYTLSLDTVNIQDKYSPVDYGHYKISFECKAREADQNPSDNKKEIFFNVTDSVYSRSGAVNTLRWSMTAGSYNLAAKENLNHFSGSIFPIFRNCEVSSISVYIAGGKADQFLNYRFVLFKVPPVSEADQTPYELLTTEMRQLDSADFNTWVTMGFQKDGESEFLKKGDLVYAGISQNNTNANYLDRRNKGLEIGTDNSVKLTEPTSIAIFDGSILSTLDGYFGKQNLMIYLNLNDHENRIDGMEAETGIASLEQNYPNPFSGNTEINYELVKESEVIFSVMDINGHRVMEVNEGLMPAGRHTFSLRRARLDPGSYFYTLKAGNFVQTKQMLIVE